MENSNFKIMTFNIRFGLANDKNNTWESRKEILVNTIKENSPDFIGFQEVNDFPLEFLKKELQDYQFTGLYNNGEKHWQQIPVFFKKEWDCLLCDHFFLSSTPLKQSKFSESQWPRQTITALFNKNNKFICITNTHFDFKDEVQKKSAKIIKARLEAYSKKIPKIICGDFNSDPTGSCYFEFTQYNGKTKFKDPFRNIHTATFHGFTGTPKSGRIDWVLYKGDISPVNKEIIKKSIQGKYPSDHFPVMVEFSFIS